jgi:hypothetical protein
MGAGQTIRGLFAIPEGFRHNGIPGAAAAFDDPVPYEQQERANELSEKTAPDRQALLELIDNAKDETDLGLATRGIAKLEFELGKFGTIKDDNASYQAVMGPVAEKYRQAVRRIGLAPNRQGDTEEETGRAVRVGVQHDEPGIIKGVNVLNDMRRTNALNKQSEAMMGYRGDAAPYKQEIVANQAKLSYRRLKTRRPMVSQSARRRWRRCAPGSPERTSSASRIF